MTKNSRRTSSILTALEKQIDLMELSGFPTKKNFIESFLLITELLADNCVEIERLQKHVEAMQRNNIHNVL